MEGKTMKEFSMPIPGRTQAPDPPMIRSWPLFGNIPELLGKPARFFLECYRKYGPVFRIRLFTRVYTVLAGPEAHFFMAREGGEFLRSREFWQGLVDEFGAKKALISTDGEIHARLRGVMKRGFSKSSIRNRYDELIDITDEMIDQDWKDGSQVGVVEAMQRMATEQLGLMVAGQAPGQYVDDMRVFIRDLLNAKVTRTRPGILLYRPAYRKARRRVFEMGHKIIDSYDTDQIDPEHPTLMDDIMAAHARDPELFEGNELMVAALSPYIAGLDTVANTTAAMLYAALKHPEALQKVRAEVDAVFAQGIPNEGTLRNMPALHGLVMETLRMYPIAILAVRYTNHEFEFYGHRVPADAPVYMATTVSHFMPEYFPEPERFDIERYQPPRSEHRKQGAFAPFGLGTHSCLGTGMAEVQMMLTMATLLNRLDLQLSPPDYTLKTIVNPAPGPEYGFKVKVLGRR
jgi:cytochrome P450